MDLLQLKTHQILTLIFLSSFVHQQCWSTRVYAHYPGDILLAAFFPVHGRIGGPKTGIDAIDSSVCGPIQEEDGVQAVEAFYYALDEINRHPLLLRGFTLGAVVLDSCDDDTHALEQAVDLIRVLMTRDDPEDLPYRCQDGRAPIVDPGAAEFYKSVGAIGGSSSEVSIQLGSLLKLFRLPQVSYLSTSPDLGQLDRFPYFKRTVPSDSNQAKAIIDILLKFGWTYVSMIYEDSNYGLKGYGEMDRVANANGVCFSFVRRIDFDETTWDDSDYEGIIKAMSDKTKVAVLWADYPRARKLFEAAARLNKTDIIWVGSDAWSGRTVAVEGLDQVVKNAITIQPLAIKLKGFDEYFTSLNPLTNNRNPWFKEFWEHHFDCVFENETSNGESERRRRSPAKSQDVQKNNSHAEIVHTDYTQPSPAQFAYAEKICTGKEDIGKASGYKQQLNIHFIKDAAQAFAHALADMQNDSCTSGLPCQSLQPANISGPDLIKYLSKVKFQSASDEKFQFQGKSKINGPPRYTIMSYREIETRGLTKSYTWVEVGKHSAVPDEKETTFDPDFEKMVTDTYPAASCSAPCTEQQARIYTKGERCCWTCFNCTDWQIVIRVTDDVDDICFTCLKGMEPNNNHTTCRYIEPTYMSHRSPWAIISMTFAILFIIIALVTTSVIIMYFNTPVIMASGRELSLVLLGFIILSYFSTFIMVSKPSIGTCSMTRIVMGICYTGIYACVLAKASRISRIFNDAAGSPAKRAKMTSPKSQMVIVGLVLLVEILVLSVWFAASPPSIKYDHPSREVRLLICTGSEDASYLIALIYPFILMLLCLFYAFKTRKTPDGFNETRLITFTSYTTVVIWLAFVALYFVNTQNIEVRVTTLCISLSMNATVALMCLFMPKVYICLFRPEKNTREAVMTRSQSVISSSNMPDQVQDASRRNSRRESDNANQAWQTGVTLDPSASALNGSAVGHRLSVSSLPVQHQHAPLRQRTNSATQTCGNLHDHYGPVYDDSRNHHQYDNEQHRYRQKERSYSDMTEKEPGSVTERWYARDNEVDIEEVALSFPNLPENGRGREPIGKADYRRISIARLKDLPGIDENSSTT